MSNMHESPSDYDEFKKRGHPGKFWQTTTVADGMTDGML